MDDNGTILGREPVFIQAVVVAGVALVTAFGLNLNSEQVAAVTGFSAVVLALIARRAVTPNVSLPK